MLHYQCAKNISLTLHVMPLHTVQPSPAPSNPGTLCLCFKHFLRTCSMASSFSSVKIRERMLLFPFLGSVPVLFCLKLMETRRSGMWLNLIWTREGFQHHGEVTLSSEAIWVRFLHSPKQAGFLPGFYLQGSYRSFQNNSTVLQRLGQFSHYW